MQAALAENLAHRAKLQLNLPYLGNQRPAKGRNRLRLRAAPAIARIKNAGCNVAFMGPKPHQRVAPRARPIHAFRQQQLPQPLATRLGHGEKQPQLGHLIAVFDTKNAAHPLATGPSNPAPFARRIMVLNELAHNLGHQPLETGVKPLFASVNKRVLFNQPAGIARH